jgi:hypothetical protein
MRKGLVVTLGVLALVLVVTPGFAVAPIISCVPDVIVSDFEDSQTQDNNLFIYPDALNLDSYVSDADTTDTSLLRWSFIQSTGPAIEISGVGSNTSGNVVNPGAFDIRAGGPLASFRNVTWSPTAGTVPFPDPPSTQADSLIELYVSDGTNTGSQTVTVTSVDEDAAGPGDRLVAQLSATYDFASGAQGWIWFSVPDPNIKQAGNQAAGSSLQMTEVAKVAGDPPVVLAVGRRRRIRPSRRIRDWAVFFVDGSRCAVRSTAPHVLVSDSERLPPR